MSDEFREALRVALDRLAFYTSVFLSGEAVGQEVIDEDHDFIREARAALAHPAPLGVPNATTHPEGYCHRCQRPNIWSWSAPSPLWNAVMRGDDDLEQYGWSIICPPCFAELAEASGVVPPGRATWRLWPDNIAADLPTIDPDGRVWDADRWLWIDSSEGGGPVQPGTAARPGVSSRRPLDLPLLGVPVGVESEEGTLDATVIASDAIGLFLEYRDQHGQPEEAARVRAVAEVVEGVAASNVRTPCPVCPHWLELHNPDGSCGCGLDCAAYASQPATPEPEQ